MTFRAASILAIAALVLGEPAYSQNDNRPQPTPPPVESTQTPLDDLDCAVRVMKILAGTLRESNKPGMSEQERTMSLRLQNRSERAMAYYIGRLDAGPKNPDLNAEIARRWARAAQLEVRVQSEQTLQCINAADQGQLAFLKSSGGK